MGTGSTLSLRDLFLILDGVHPRLSYFAEALTPIEERLGYATIAADLYYAPSTGVGLLAIHLDWTKLRLSDARWTLRQAEAAGIPLLDPTRLDAGDRAAFFGSYLDGYDERIFGAPGPRAALSELGTRLGVRLERTSANDELQDMVTIRDPRPAGLDRGLERHLPSPGNVATAPRPKGSPQPRLAHPRLCATPPPVPDALKNRRLGSSPPSTPRRAAVPRGRMPRGKLGPLHQSPRQRQRFSLVEQAAMARSQRVRRAPTVPYPLDGEVSEPNGGIAHGPDRPMGKRKARQRKPTVPETPIAKVAAPVMPPKDGTRKGQAPPPARKLPGRRVADGTGPNPILDAKALLAPPISARYQRGGDWVPARLRSLSLKGSYLVANALPRKGEDIRVELSFDGLKAKAIGHVYHVTSIEDAADTGAAGFAIRFQKPNEPYRAQLVALLKHARAAGIKLKPPPERRSVRFPVSWPVQVGSLEGGFRAEALDLSTGGLFVATNRDLTEDELAFRLPLDNGEPPVCGRARVARQLESDAALERGLQPGYGLRIVGLSDVDSPRYDAFLHRVRKRVERRVLVAAAPGRLKQLMAAFAAIGYSVTGGSETHTVLRLADQGNVRPDVAIIDSTLTACGQDKNGLARAFTDRGVTCVPSDNEPPTLTRAVVDRVLGVNA